MGWEGRSSKYPRKSPGEGLEGPEPAKGRVEGGEGLQTARKFAG